MACDGFNQKPFYVAQMNFDFLKFCCVILNIFCGAYFCTTGYLLQQGEHCGRYVPLHLAFFEETHGNRITFTQADCLSTLRSWLRKGTLLYCNKIWIFDLLNRAHVIRKPLFYILHCITTFFCLPSPSYSPFLVHSKVNGAGFLTVCSPIFSVVLAKSERSLSCPGESMVLLVCIQYFT